MTRPPLAAWGLDGTPEPLPGGHRNTVLRVGDHVLKSTRRSEAAIAWLLPVADALLPHKLHVPRPLRSSNGAFVVEGWTCEPFVRGAPCDPSALTAWQGRSYGLRQRDGFASAAALRSLSTGGDIDLRRMPAPLVRAIHHAWAALPKASPCLVHGDLTRSNLLENETGITILDWDEARLDHPGFDRVALDSANAVERRAADAWEIACCWQIEPARARGLARDFISATVRAGKA